MSGAVGWQVVPRAVAVAPASVEAGRPVPGYEGLGLGV